MATAIGSMKFHFKEGATAPATLTDATLYPVKFPEGTGEFTPNVETIDNEEPVAGILRVTRTVVTKGTFEYSYTVKSYDYNTLAFFLGGSTPTTNTPPSTIAIGGDLAHTGYGLVEFYDNGDVSGTPRSKHYGFTCQVIPDGSYSLEPGKFTEIKFKIKITATLGTYA